MYQNRRDYFFYCSWVANFYWEIATLFAKTLYVKLIHTHICVDPSWWRFKYDKLYYPSHLTCHQIPCKLPHMVSIRELIFILLIFIAYLLYLGDNAFILPCVSKSKQVLRLSVSKQSCGSYDVVGYILALSIVNVYNVLFQFWLSIVSMRYYT